MLGELIDQGTRLVSFINALVPDKENTPFLLNKFDIVWGDKYDIRDTGLFACTHERPFNGTTIQEMHNYSKVFFVNHPLYRQQALGIQVSDVRSIAKTSSWAGPGGLGAHMLQCSSAVARQSTFVLMGFFNVG